MPRHEKTDGPCPPPSKQHAQYRIYSENRPGTRRYFPLYIAELHPRTCNHPGMRFRTSLRWFDTNHDQLMVRSVPFISKVGKLTVYTLYYWKCYQHQLFASLIATVYQRLQSILYKRYKGKGSRYFKVALKVAIVYALTHDDRLIDRFLGASSNGRPVAAAQSLAHIGVSNLDGKQRFVYSQAYLQGTWLRYLALRPRDKSRKEDVTEHLGKLLGSPAISKIYKKSRDLSNLLLHVWQTTRFDYRKPGGRSTLAWTGSSRIRSEPKPFFKMTEADFFNLG